jgi:hypothetical protein
MLFATSSKHLLLLKARPFPILPGNSSALTRHSNFVSLTSRRLPDLLLIGRYRLPGLAFSTSSEIFCTAVDDVFTYMHQKIDMVAIAILVVPMTSMLIQTIESSAGDADWLSEVLLLIRTLRLQQGQPGPHKILLAELGTHAA